MGGQRWVCNLCGKESDGNASLAGCLPRRPFANGPCRSVVHAEYFSGLDHSGRRADLADRPELTVGTVDFMVGKDYWALPPPPQLLPSYADDTHPVQSISPSQPPQTMCTLFMINVSQSAAASGMVRHVCNAIRELLYESTTLTAGNPPFENQRVGFMTFDSTLHFYSVDVSHGILPDVRSSALIYIRYNIKLHLTTPKMLVVPDIDDVFTPFRNGLFSDPTASRFAADVFSQ